MFRLSDFNSVQSQFMLAYLKSYTVLSYTRGGSLSICVMQRTYTHASRQGWETGGGAKRVMRLF